MSFTLYKKNPTSGEVTSSLTNASDGQGLHFDGAAGNIDIDSPPNLGTKFSFEFVIQADSWGSANSFLLDFYAASTRFILGSHSTPSYNLSIYTPSSWVSFGTKVLDDLKVHHLVVTVDGTSAIAYDNGNQVGTLTAASSDQIDGATDARVGSDYSGANFFDGTIYRARFWNKTLTAPEVTASFENSTVPFSDQYGSQTELITDWTNNGSYLYETFTKSGTTITEFANTSGAGICYSAVTLAAGKKYRIEQTFTLNSGTAPALRVGTTTNVGTGGFLDVVPTSASEFEFTATTGGTFYVGYRIDSPDVCNFAVSGFSFVEIGCVADYELSANPTQSTTVQDRAGAADGTASSGVTQITPIEAVNTNKLSVGGTTPLVGIGLAAGVTPARTLHVSSANTVPVQVDSATTQCHINLKNSAADTCYLLFENTDFKVLNGGYTRLTISSAGLVTASGTASVDNLTTTAKLHNSAANTCGLQLVDNAGKVCLQSASGALQIWTDSQTEGNNFVAGDLAMTIDSAGVLTLGQTDALINTGTSNGSDTKSITIDSGAASSARGAYAQVCGNQHATLGGKLILQTGNSSEASASAGLYIRKDGGVDSVVAPATGGIYEVGGVLKENLLTNSGFDVWSNSTLETVATIEEDDCASDDTGDWTKSASVTLGFDTDHYEIASPDQDAQIHLPNISLTAGKLYRISFNVKNGTASGCTVKTFFYDDASQYGADTTTTGSFETVATVFEAAATTSSGQAGVRVDTDLNNNNIEINNFSLKEVTPGVLGGTRAADGWGSGGLNTYREHWNGSGGDSDTTKTGSFYALKMVNASSSGYVEQLLDLGKFRGRTITLGVWVKTSTGSAARTKINGTVTTDVWSDYATDSDNWEWLETTMNVSASETYLLIQLRTEVASTVYWSQPILSLGSAIGEGNYSRPSGEIVWCEQPIDSNAFPGVTVSSNTTVGVEVDTNGKVPKGAKAVYAKLDGESAAVEKYLRLYPNGLSVYGAALFSQVANVRQSAQGFVQLDSSGDIRIARDDTFNTVGVTYQAVVLQ